MGLLALPLAFLVTTFTDYRASNDLDTSLPSDVPDTDGAI
jgi:hypothetical protein